MRLITILILVMFSGCQVPQFKILERCTANFQFNYASKDDQDNFFESIEKYKINPELRANFIKDAASIFGKTVCHQYNINLPGRISELVQKPLIYSNNLTGFSDTAWATEITPKIKEIKRWYRDSGGRNDKGAFLEKQGDAIDPD